MHDRFNHTVLEMDVEDFGTLNQESNRILLAGLNGLSSTCLEDNGAKSNVDYEGLAQISKANNISTWARGHSCHIYTKNVAAFCPCP